MIAIAIVAALAVLALVTQAGVLVLQRKHPAQGQKIEVAGATLNVLDIGPRDAAGPPIVMIHGASSNLETMRHPLGDLLARQHRVILIDRPGHGWSTRGRLEDSTPAIQGRMIDEALEKLGPGPAIFVVHSWAGARGARMALDHPRRVAGLVMLAPVAYPWPGGVGWYNEVVTTPVIGPLLAYDQRHNAELVPTLREFLACSGSWNACAARMYVHVNTVRYRIRRIEELTGRDLSSLDDQVDFFLALRIR